MRKVEPPTNQRHQEDTCICLIYTIKGGLRKLVLFKGITISNLSSPTAISEIK